MTQRITQSMLNTQLLRNLNNNMNRLDGLQQQLATGKKINKPSDDPVGISFSMRYRSELSANDQYQANADAALSWMEFSDTMLGQAGSVLQRVRELTVNAANTGTNFEQSWEAIRVEVQQLHEQMVTIGNSQFNGKFVFNGQLTDKEPYTIGQAATEKTDDRSIPFEVGAGVKMTVNVTGMQVFGAPTDGDNVFRLFNDLTTAFQSGDGPLMDATLAKLDTRMDQMLNVRSELGAKINRIQLAEGRLQDINTNLQSLQSKTEDADMAIVITNLKTEENIYQASLATGSKLIQPSLIDFLR